MKSVLFLSRPATQKKSFLGLFLLIVILIIQSGYLLSNGMLKNITLAGNFQNMPY